jgi:hypothetical protein
LQGLTVGKQAGQYNFGKPSQTSAESVQKTQPVEQKNSGPTLVPSALKNVAEALNSKAPKNQGSSSPVNFCFMFNIKDVLINQTVKELLKSNGQTISEEEECVLSLISPLRVGDLF